MRFISNLFQFYINSSIHVALAVLAFVGITLFEYDISVSNSFPWYIFLATITGYNFVKYAPVAGLHHRSLAQSLRVIQVFSFIAFLGLLCVSWLQPIPVLVGTFVLGLLTLLYAIPLLKNRSLRTIAGLKIFIVALVWAGSTVFLPAVFGGILNHLDVWISFIQRLLLVMVLTLPFEIRDLPYDKRTLGTIPQRMGVRTTKWLGTISIVLILLVEWMKESAADVHFYYLIGICAITTIALWKASPKQSSYFASFWVEGIPILGWLLYYGLLQITS
ncbi:UbiA prenyltransferase family protein [Luteirhabdus pelagi]|uniref:hypothetical protein n=1 Tax=Luteirhabdus pelagi TaxID=2792783 RepID=UPI0019394F33|nr:hypothetical protein [Luteirhabdus pelagi]